MLESTGVAFEKQDLAKPENQTFTPTSASSDDSLDSLFGSDMDIDEDPNDINAIQPLDLKDLPLANSHIMAEFDLDALFEENDQDKPSTSSSSQRDDHQSTPPDFFSLHLPQLPSTPQDLTPPGDCDLDTLLLADMKKRSLEDERDTTEQHKKSKYTSSPKESQFHFPQAPATLTPPLETLTPDSSTVPSPSASSLDISLSIMNTTKSLSLAQINRAINNVKSRMVSSHELVTSYKDLKQKSASCNAQMQTCSADLKNANKWRFILADENARLRSKITLITKEKEQLKSVIKKLHSDTNGLRKNEILRNEIVEKNVEIARLRKRCGEIWLRAPGNLFSGNGYCIVYIIYM